MCVCGGGRGGMGSRAFIYPHSVIKILHHTILCLCPISVIPDDSPFQQETRNVSLTQGKKPGGMEDSGYSSGCVFTLPSQVVERNRLTVAEICTLPRFRDYCAGEPSSVRQDASSIISILYSSPYTCCMSLFYMVNIWNMCTGPV